MKTLIFFIIYWFLERKGETERGREEREEESERNICCSTYLRIHWWTPVCALTGDQTRNHGTSGQRCDNWATPPEPGKSLFDDNTIIYW